MIDINTIISNALTAAVQEAIKPLVEEIERLKFVDADRHQRLRELEGALTDRVAALENNPAQGVDTDMADIPELGARFFDGAILTRPGENLIDKLAEASLNYLNDQEWFWEKLHNKIGATVEGAIENHCETYDHDSYDSAVSDFEDMPSLDDYVTRDEVRSEVAGVLNNATISLRV